MACEKAEGIGIGDRHSLELRLEKTPVKHPVMTIILDFELIAKLEDSMCVFIPSPVKVGRHPPSWSSKIV